MKSLGIEVRAGLHTGEVELRGEDVTGMGVNIAARVMDAAGRVLRVDAILAHNQYWVAQWITRTLDDSIAVAHRWGP